MEKVSIASSPAKIILFGEQCVVHGSKAIATSLDLRTYCKVTRMNTQEVMLDMPDIGKTITWKSEELIYKEPKPTSSNKIAEPLFLQFLEEKAQGDKGVVAFLYLYLSIVGDDFVSRGGLKVTLMSDFQPGVGMGSSAAFNVSISSALIDFFNIVPSTDRFEDGDATDLLVFQNSVKNEINSWAFEAEKIMHGSPSGIDNSICTYGSAISFKQGNIDIIDHVPNVELIITNTKVPRSTKILVGNVGKLHKQLPSITTPLFDAVDKISERALDIFKESKCKSIMGPEDLEMELNTLIDINQNILNAIGVGHESLDKIIDTGKEFSFYSKLTGAGGGGCAFTLIPKGTNEDRIAEFISKINILGFDTFRAIIGAPGVYLHRTEPSIFVENRSH